MLRKWLTSTDVLALLGTLLFACVLAMYLQTCRFEYINLDDHDYTMTCPFVTDGFSWENLQTAVTTLTYGAIWMPLTWLSYMVEISLVGHNPGVMHLTSGVFHACNAVWLFLLLAALLNGGRAQEEQCAVSRTQGTPFRACLIAFVAAAFWAVHPLRAESAAWVASRKDVVFLFFELLALLFWVRYVKAGRDDAGSRRGSVSYGISMVLFVLACMGKPMAMTFPVLACLLEFLLAGRIRWRGIVLPMLIGIVCGLVAHYSQTFGGGTGPLADTTAPWRLQNAIAAFGQYCRQTIWPYGLHMLYPPRFPKMPDHLVLGLLVCLAYAVCLLAALVCALPASVLPRPLQTIRSRLAWSSDVCRVVFVGLAWFLLAIGPALGITANFGWHSHADRFTYLPSIGFSILLAGLLGQLTNRRALALAVGAALCATMYVGWLGYRQIGFWKNDVTIFERGYRLSKPNAHLDTMLAMAYLKFPEKLGEIYRILNESVQAAPNDKNLGALGFVMALKGETPEELSSALTYAKRSYALNPEEPMSTATLGLVALRRQEWAEANRLLTASILNAKNPQAPIFDWLGMARYNLKDYKGALWAFNQACLRVPNDPNLRRKLDQAAQKLFPDERSPRP